MAKAHSTPKNHSTKTPTTTRTYTVGYQTGQRDNTTPAIHLKGKWLSEADFDTDASLVIRIMEGG
ncbi:SymE family type I addiction module toxin [Serratia rubidaea]|nr:SymE family type I addiction module toxin [Serratia rubidaea]MCR1000741.1 type I toxin-antitoxin system SymE family toxin [Serratia rubidaea]